MSQAWRMRAMSITSLQRAGFSRLLIALLLLGYWRCGDIG
jgi:hypothetical protein